MGAPWPLPRTPEGLNLSGFVKVSVLADHARKGIRLGSGYISTDLVLTVLISFKINATFPPLFHLKKGEEYIYPTICNVSIKCKVKH